jgi:cell division protein FtsI (penicillin-binding protein 3)
MKTQSLTVKSEKKLKLVIFLIFALYFLVLARAFYIQVIAGENYVKKVLADFPKGRIIKITSYRGSILDKNGQPLAISLPTISIYAFPKLIQNKQELADKLSKILGLPQFQILNTLNSKERFVWIARHVSQSDKGLVEQAILDTNNSKGVGVQSDFKRFYPNHNVASNLIGFVGWDGKGLDGMEYALNKYLGGKPIEVMTIFAPKEGKMVLKPLSIQDTGTQNDVYLTIDMGVQSIVEDIKNQLVKEFNPRRVAIVVEDVRNGNILGMATYPDFDPNDYYNYPQRDWRNSAVTDVFEPGSVMKPFFLGYAMAKGYIHRGETCNANGGKGDFYGHIVTDVEHNGILTMSQILIVSSNVCAMKVASHLTREDAENVVNLFHLVKPYNIIPGEQAGILPNFYYPINRMFATIGQGIAVNALNLANAYAALATDNLLKPHIIRKIVNPLGQVIYHEHVDVIHKDIYPQSTIDWLHYALEQVVEKGTGISAKSNHFTIAGKTGTSQIFNFKTGHYSWRKVVAVFAGFFPVSNPRFSAVIVAYDPHPKNGALAWGGSVSAPYFKELVDRISFYYAIKPDKAEQSK